MSKFDLIAFDADDTLWHSETLYNDAQERFRQLLAHYHSPEWIDERLLAIETRNLEHFGYGVKSFALSMIETAIDLTEGRITAGEIQQILDMAKEMLSAEVQLIEHVPAIVAQLAQRYPLMVITKGDLLHQEAKVARSGLAGHFKHIEVVSEKSPESYGLLLRRHGIAPERFVMVGNSLRSDVLPVVELGGHAVYIPYHLTWAHEQVTLPAGEARRYHELEHIGQLPALLERLEQGQGAGEGG